MPEGGWREAGVMTWQNTFSHPTLTGAALSCYVELPTNILVFEEFETVDLDLPF